MTYRQRVPRGPYRIAKLFYTLKGLEIADNFGPSFSSWIHFVRTRDKIVSIGAKKEWKHYLFAQFHYCPEVDRLYPAMLYSDRAVEKFRWYLKLKQNRVGLLKGADIEDAFQHRREVEVRTKMHLLEGFFSDGAWKFQAFVRRGFSPLETIIIFGKEFHPLFSAMAIWDDLAAKTPDIPADVVRAFHTIREYKDGRYEEKLRELYEQSTKRQSARWDEYNPAWVSDTGALQSGDL